MSGWLWVAGGCRADRPSGGLLLSLLRGWLESSAPDPRLTPWAVFFCRFAADIISGWVGGWAVTHGLRRGLWSCAPSELGVVVRFGNCRLDIGLGL